MTCQQLTDGGITVRRSATEQATSPRRAASFSEVAVLCRRGRELDRRREGLAVLRVGHRAASYTRWPRGRRNRGSKSSKRLKRLKLCGSLSFIKAEP